MKSWWRRYAESKGDVSTAKGSWKRRAAGLMAATRTNCYDRSIAIKIGLPYAKGSWLKRGSAIHPVNGSHIRKLAGF